MDVFDQLEKQLNKTEVDQENMEVTVTLDISTKRELEKLVERTSNNKDYIINAAIKLLGNNYSMCHNLNKDQE